MIKGKYFIELALVFSFFAFVTWNSRKVEDIETKTLTDSKVYIYSHRTFNTLSFGNFTNATLPARCPTEQTFNVTGNNTCFIHTGSKCCNQNVSLPNFDQCAGECRRLLEQFWCETSCIPKNRFCNPSLLWGLIGICSQTCPQLVGKYIPDDSQAQSFLLTFGNSTNDCRNETTNTTCVPCKVGIDANCTQAGSDVECARNCNYYSMSLGLCNMSRCSCPKKMPTCRPCNSTDDQNPEGPLCDKPALSVEECSSICPAGIYDSALCNGSRCVCNGVPPQVKRCRPCNPSKDPFCVHPASVPECQRICPLGLYDSKNCDGSRCTCNGAGPNITSDMCTPCKPSDPLCVSPATFGECQSICPNRTYDDADCNGSRCTCPTTSVGTCRPCNPAKDPLCVRPASVPACKAMCPLGRYQGLCDGSRCTCVTNSSNPAPPSTISSWTVNGALSYTNLSISGILELTFQGVISDPSNTQPDAVIQWVDTRGKLFAEVAVPKPWKKMDGNDNSTFYGFTNIARLDSMRISSSIPSKFYVYLWVQFPKSTSNVKFSVLDDDDDKNENKKGGWVFARVDVTIQRAKSIPIPDNYIPNVCDGSGFDTAQIEENSKPYGGINCALCPQNCRVQFPTVTVTIRIVIVQLVVAITEYRNGNALIKSFSSPASKDERVLKLVDTKLVFTETIVIESQVTIQYTGSSIVNFGRGSVCRIRNHFRSLPPTAIYGSIVVETAVIVTFSSRFMIYGETGDINLDHPNATLELDYNYTANSNTTNNNTTNNTTTDTTTFDTNSTEITNSSFTDNNSTSNSTGNSTNPPPPNNGTSNSTNPPDNSTSSNSTNPPPPNNSTSNSTNPPNNSTSNSSNPTPPTPTCTPDIWTCNNITTISIFNSSGLLINTTTLTSSPFNSSVNLSIAACIFNSIINSTTNITTNSSVCSSCMVLTTSCSNNTNVTNSTNPPPVNNTNSTVPPNPNCPTIFTCTNNTNSSTFNASGILISSNSLTSQSFNSSVNLTACIFNSVFNSTTNQTTNSTICPTCTAIPICVNNNTTTPNITNTTNPTNTTGNSTNTSEDTRVGPVIVFKNPIVSISVIKVITIAESSFYLSRGKCRGKGRIKMGKGHARHYKFTFSLRVVMTVAIQFSFPTRWRAMWPKETPVQGSMSLCASTYGQGSITLLDGTALITETTCALQNIVQETGTTLQVSSNTDSASVTVGTGGTLGFTQVSSSSVLDIKGNLVMDTGSILSLQVTKNPINALFLRWESSTCTMPKATQTITGCDNCEILMDKEGNSHCTLRIATKTATSPSPSASSSPSPSPSSSPSPSASTSPSSNNPSPSTSLSPTTSSPTASVPVVTNPTTAKSSSSDNKAMLGLIALAAIPIIVVIAILVYFGVKSAGASAAAEEVDVTKLSAPQYAQGYQPYDPETPISTPTHV